MCVLRPKDKNALFTILANIYTNEFNIQHQALTTGSIMECISTEDINNILIKKDIDKKAYIDVYNAIVSLKNALIKINT